MGDFSVGEMDRKKYGPMEHDLKCWPEYFCEIVAGRKRYELRKDDRVPDFMVGDVLKLREWSPITQEYTGRVSYQYVTHTLRNHEGLAPSFCIMGIQARDMEAPRAVTLMSETASAFGPQSHEDKH